MAVQWRHRRQGQTTATCHKMIIRCEQQHYTCCFMTRMSTSEMNENLFFFFLYIQQKTWQYLFIAREGRWKNCYVLVEAFIVEKIFIFKTINDIRTKCYLIFFSKKTKQHIFLTITKKKRLINQSKFTCTYRNA